MGRRVELHNILKQVLGSGNVYFEPAESFKLKYPCIVYFMEGNAEWHADNNPYHRMQRYSLTYITQQADDPMVDKIDSIKYCSLNRPFTTSGLRHYPYTLFY